MLLLLLWLCVWLSVLGVNNWCVLPEMGFSSERQNSPSLFSSQVFQTREDRDQASTHACTHTHTYPNNNNNNLHFDTSGHTKAFLSCVNLGCMKYMQVICIMLQKTSLNTCSFSPTLSNFFEFLSQTAPVYSLDFNGVCCLFFLILHADSLSSLWMNHLHKH